MAKTESAPIPTTNALVVVADPPLDNRLPTGKKSLGVVQIVVETGAAPIMTSRRFKLDREHWLVPGMTIPVMLDPANPAGFDIDWASIPSIQDRAAANDPTLTDPIGTRKKMADEIVRASSSPDVAKLPEALRESMQQFANPAPPVDHFAESMAKAKTTVAPEGKQSAVVLIATTAGTWTTDSVGDEGGVDTHHGLFGVKHDAVLSVNVPGQPAYAVFVHELRQPNYEGDVVDGGFPAFVSLSDPNDVDVQWQDAPSMGSQISDTMDSALDEMGAKEQMLLAARGQMAAEMQPGAAAPSSFGPPPPVPTGTAVNPAMQAMMAQSAQMMLNMATDPAQRAILVQQYRLAGIPLPDEPSQ